MLQSRREETGGRLQMLLSLRKNGLTSLFKEFRVLKVPAHREFRTLRSSMVRVVEPMKFQQVPEHGCVHGWFQAVKVRLPFQQRRFSGDFSIS